MSLIAPIRDPLIYAADGSILLDLSESSAASPVVVAPAGLNLQPGASGASALTLTPHAGQTAPLLEANGKALVGTDGSVASTALAAAGVPIVRKFPFAFNTPNILTGADLFTPNVNDLIFGMWVSVSQAWNGVTPLGDISTFTGVGTGLFANWGVGALDMTRGELPFDGGLVGIQQMGDFGMSFATENVVGILRLGASPALEVIPHNPTPSDLGAAMPLRVTDAIPIRVCVSQTGRNDGADPGSTQGAAVLYLMMVTPV